MKFVSIGRSNDNDLVVKEETVSRHHARLHYHSGSWYIVDLESTHGTSVNGVKISEAVKLKPSDKIKLGNVELVYDGNHIFSDKGIALVILKEPASSKMSKLQRNAYAGSSLYGSISYRKNRFKLLFYAGTASVFLLIAVFILLHYYNKPPAVFYRMSGVTPEASISYGTLEYNGGEYTGYFKNGVPHGYGTLIIGSGRKSLSYHDIITQNRVEKYVGEWKGGLKHGYGKMHLPDGAIIEGDWKDGHYIGSSSD